MEVSESGIIIGYNNSLYYLHSSDDFKDIGMISTVSFDSNNIYSNSGTYIRKYKGNEKDLLKVTFSRSVLNTDGSPYPILIYKDGSIESIEEVEKKLKNYKIKDFISEDCIQRDNNNFCTSASYDVIIQDGTKQVIK